MPFCSSCYISFNFNFQLSLLRISPFSVQGGHTTLNVLGSPFEKIIFVRTWGKVFENRLGPGRFWNLM